MPSPIAQIRIPQKLLDQAKAQAEAERRSLSAWVRLLIEDRLRGAGSDPEGLWPENFWTRKHWEEASRNLKQASVSQQEENRSPKPLKIGSCSANPKYQDKTAEQIQQIVELLNEANQASIAQQRTERSATSREGAGSTPARRAGRGSPASGVRAEGSRAEVRNESPSRPIKCVCGGVILQDGPKAGKCTKCAKPRASNE